MNPFKKSKLRRQLFREQQKLLDEELSLRADGQMTPEQSRHLRAHLQRTTDLLAKLTPREPMDPVEFFVRTGIAIILFILLIAPPYTYFRNLFFSPAQTSQSSASGAVSVRAYIPEIPVSQASMMWGRRDTDGPVEFTHSTDFRGMTAGIVPADLEGQVGEAVFWTEPQGNKLVLRKLVTDAFFRPTQTTTSTVWDDQNFTSAAVVSTGTQVLVAAGYQASSGPAVALQLFDLAGAPLTPRVQVALAAGESIDDIQAEPWAHGWALVTHIPKGADAALYDPSKVELRVLDQKLIVSDHVELGISGYEIGNFPLVLPDQSGNGYAIVDSGHSSIRAQNEQSGDRLFAFQFSQAGTMQRVLRLTDTGGQYDFWPTGLAQTPNGDYVIGVQNLPGWSFDDPKVHYPLNAGRAYQRIYDPSFQMAGALIVFDDPALKDMADRRGVTHLRQVLIGDRIYSAFDLINEQSSETGKPDRSVQAMWMHLSPQ